MTPCPPLGIFSAGRAVCCLALAHALEREETLDESEIEALIGPPAYRKPQPAAVAAGNAATS